MEETTQTAGATVDAVATLEAPTAEATQPEVVEATEPPQAE
jgi:hypothetical protein